MSIQYIPKRNPLTITTDDEINELTSLNSTPRQSPSPTTSQQYQNKFISKRKKIITDSIQRPITRSRSISERAGGGRNSTTETSPIVTRKRKASIVNELNSNEIKRPTIDYLHHLDGKSFVSFFFSK